MRPWLLLCSLLLLGFQPQEHVPMDTSPPALYVAYPLGGLEPVALFDSVRQQLVAPPQDRQESLSFFQKNLPLFTELELFLNGEVKNLLTTGPFREPAPSCKGSGMFAGRFRHTDRTLVPLIAFSKDFPGPRRYPGNYPASHLKTIALRLSRETYRRHHVPANQLKQLHIRRIVPFTMDNGASVQFAVSSTLGKGTSPCPNHSLLLVVEKLGRRYLRRVEKYHADQNQKHCMAHDFISSFATDAVVDKILIQGISRQARWYEVLQRQPQGTYRSIYHGGGYSCSKKIQN